MIFTPYIALIAAMRFALCVVVVVGMYGAWLMACDMIWPTDTPEGDE